MAVLGQPPYAQAARAGMTTRKTSQIDFMASFANATRGRVVDGDEVDDAGGRGGVSIHRVATRSAGRIGASNVRDGSATRHLESVARERAHARGAPVLRRDAAAVPLDSRRVESVTVSAGGRHASERGGDRQCRDC
jgi:hypothetical protein